MHRLSLVQVQARFLAVSMKEFRAFFVKSGVENRSFSKWKDQFHYLQANKSAGQGEISKLQTHFNDAILFAAGPAIDEDLLNSSIYFHSLFSKIVPEKLISLSFNQLGLINGNVFRVLSQKLLRQNRWSTAESLIEKKFDCPRTREQFKFEIFAVNGNFRKMLESLSNLGQLSFSPKVQLHLRYILTSGEGKNQLDRLDAEDERFYPLLWTALRGRVLSPLNVPSLTVFLQLFNQLSFISDSHDAGSLLFLGLTRCSFSNCSDPELVSSFSKIISRLSIVSTLDLMGRLRNRSDISVPEFIPIILRKVLKYPKEIEAISISTLLCWIVKYLPEEYGFRVLLHDFPSLVDSSVAQMALNSLSLHSAYAIEFVEFCLQRKIQMPKNQLADVVDIAIEHYKVSISSDFLNLVHSGGYRLSNRFYFNRVLQDPFCNYSDFSKIDPSELDQQDRISYEAIGSTLVKRLLGEGEVGKAFQIHDKIFSDKESFSNVLLRHLNQFSLFKPDGNRHCLKHVFDVAERNEKSTQLSEEFCIEILKSFLRVADFEMAQRVRVYMTNNSFTDISVNYPASVLRYWLMKM